MRLKDSAIRWLGVIKPNTRQLIRVSLSFVVLLVVWFVLVRYGDVLVNRQEVVNWLNDRLKFLHPRISDWLVRYGWQLLAALVPTAVAYRLLDPLAEKIGKSLSSGQSVFISGDLQFRNPYPALNEYYRDFSNDLSSADEFVGRKGVFAFLDEVEKSKPCGYVRLTAAACLGKSTLAAAVARRKRAASFFTNSSSGLARPDLCLNHLSVVLIARFQLRHDQLPPRAGDDSSFFERVLKEVAHEAGKPLWLVVDAVDEADEAISGRNTLLLPSHLPHGIYVFVTQRPGDYPLLTDPDTPLEEYEINSDSPSQQADVSEFLQRQAQREEIARALRMFTPPLTQDSFVSRLQEASESNFMYLSYLLTDMAAGELPFTSFDASAIPRGLRGYYVAMWSRMEAVARAEGGNLWSSLYRPIIGLLAVAREPITLRWLAELNGTDIADIRDHFLGAWRRFLNKEGQGEGAKWSLLHRSFGDFLNEKLDLPQVHATVAARYRQLANWATHGGYASKHLSTHLRLCGDVKELLALVEDRSWYESQMVWDPTAMLFQADLSQARSAAMAVDVEEVKQGRLATWIAGEIRLALATTTLNSFWRNIRPKALAAFLKAGVLGDSQVLALATNNPDPTGRSFFPGGARVTA